VPWSLPLIDRGPIVAFYWDNPPVWHDRPLITNCYALGLARACGLHPKSAKQERDFDMCALNAVYGHQERRQVSYSLNWNHDYRGYFSRPRAISAVTAFADAGMFEHRKSYQGQLGRQSNFWATPALMEVFYNLRPEVVYEESPVVITRSRETGLIIPSRPMRRVVRLIEAINEMQGSIDIGLDKTGAVKGPNSLWTFGSKKQKRNGDWIATYHKLRLEILAGRRVYTRDHNHHGRYYCPLQNIPGAVRGLITIDGEPVVELDFVAVHVAIAYALAGVPMDGDPYVIPKWKNRKQVKIALLTYFNAKTEQKAIAALTDAREGKPVCATRKEAARLLEAIEGRHPAIADLFGADAGMRLMNLDSRIMLAAVAYLMDRGIKCVPIHDSLVVPARYEGIAVEALAYGWKVALPSYAHGIGVSRKNLLQYGPDVFSGLGPEMGLDEDPGLGKDVGQFEGLGWQSVG
jgi:hypothetical protein